MMSVYSAPACLPLAWNELYLDFWLNNDSTQFAWLHFSLPQKALRQLYL